MDKLTIFAEYLEKVGHDINEFSLQDAVSLHKDVEKLIESKKLKNK